MTNDGRRASRSNSSLWLSSPYTEPFSDASDNEEDADADATDDLEDTLSLIGLGSSDRYHNDAQSPAFVQSENELSSVFERHKLDAYSQLHDHLLPPVITCVSPSGHFVEFAAENETEDTGFREDTSIWGDKNSMLGQIRSLVQLDDATSFMNKQVQEQAKVGARQLDKITTIPLSAFWHIFTEVAGIVVFLANVCVALVDIFLKDAQGNYENLHYKIPTFVMGVFENLVLVAWFFVRPKDETGTGTGNSTKYQQYSENILHEVLLYPLVILSVIGFANDKLYTKPGTFFDWLGIVLLSFDAFDLLQTQVLRVAMIRTFVKDVRGFLGADEVNIGANVLRRAVATTVANFAVFVLLILLLGAQMHDDNYESENYSVSIRTAVFMVALMTLPLFNLFMFVVVNVPWLIELLLLLGSRSQSEDADRLREKELGALAVDVAQMAHASEAVKKRLEKVRRVHPFKRLIGVAAEPRLAALILLWQVIALLAVYSFDGCHHISVCQGYIAQWVFAGVAIVTNSHLVVVVFLCNVLVCCVVAAMLFYPLTVPLLVG